MTAPQGRLTDRPARISFGLLVAACIVAFFLTQRLKHTPTAVQLFKMTPYFSPTPSGHIKEERISFRLARGEDVTVTIVDSSGADVATLVSDHYVTRYKPISLHWNGRRGAAHSYRLLEQANGHPALVPDNRGPFASPGEYRVRVSLSRRHPAVLSPRSFTLRRP